jgi:hypothetical protein
MKRTFTLIISFFLALSAFAHPNQSRLTITSVSKYPVRVLVDGRSYSERNNNLNEVQIRDLRPGYHSVKVYQQRPGRSWGNGPSYQNNNMKLLYESRIYIKPNFHVDILINRFGKIFIDERNLSADYYANDDYDDDGNYNWDDDYNYRQPIDAKSFELLKQTISNEAFDNTKLSIARQAVSQQYFTAAQVKEIVQLFSFEKSKLDIAKYCYSRTVDKNNYFIINDAFSFSASKEELSKFIQAEK